MLRPPLFLIYESIIDDSSQNAVVQYFLAVDLRSMQEILVCGLDQYYIWCTLLQVLMMHEI